MTTSGMLRTTVLVIGGIETAAMLALVGMVALRGQLSSGEALSRSIGWAILQIYGLPWLLCVVPALVLAIRGRLLKLALLLTVLAVPLALVSVHFA